MKSATGVGEEELLWKSPENKWPDDWAPDGKSLLVESLTGDSQVDLYLLPVTGERKPVPVLTSPSNEAHAAFSPDGRFFSYTSDETGRPEIYVQTFPPSGGKWQVSKAGGDQGIWRRDGKELFYLASDGKLMAVPVTTGAVFTAGAPQALFEPVTAEASPSGARNFYVPSLDGSRFLVLSYARPAREVPVHLLVNWSPGAEGERP
ncbi:MAG: hypothetical protein NEA02_06010 [Thermoanaerobaculia bacterium]|nr:hypothetical protein [Thermoanaerobaculia bacterium]